jgi:hypothetical protein
MVFDVGCQSWPQVRSKFQDCKPREIPTWVLVRLGQSSASLTFAVGTLSRLPVVEGAVAVVEEEVPVVDEALPVVVDEVPLLTEVAVLSGELDPEDVDAAHAVCVFARLKEALDLRFNITDDERYH